MMENNLELDTIVSIISNQPNLYLADQMEDYIYCASFRENPTFPHYYPQEFQNKVRGAFACLKNMTQLQRDSSIKLIKKKIQGIPIREDKYWSGASKLLRLDCIKAISFEERKKMSQMLLSYKKSLFERYIKSLHQNHNLSKQMLQEEMRLKNYRQKSFQELIHGVKQRPNLKPSLAYFLHKCKKRQSLAQAEGLIITVESEDSKIGSKIEGLIFSAKAQGNFIRLLVQAKSIEYTMKVSFDSQYLYIQAIEVQAKSFGQQLKKSKIQEVQKIYKYTSYSRSIKCISFRNVIKNNRELDIYIDARKSYLVNMLYEGHYRLQYEQLFKHLIKRQLIDFKSQSSFLQEVEKLVKIIQNVGKKEQPNQVAVSLLLNANFQEFMNVGSEFNNKKICEMLAISEQKAELIKGKKIISFFGATGAGKSTCINYLLGFNLKSLVSEDRGLTHYCIEDQQLAALKEGEDYARTSSSAIISQTLYSVGYRIRNGVYSQQLMAHDVYLCDNPGFRDTREREEQLIIGDSIDKCISNCQSIKAVVLVLPYIVFNERSCNLFTHLQQLSDLFPNLLDNDHTVFDNFYLMITKCPPEVDFESILNQFKSELMKDEVKLQTIQRINEMYSSGRVIVVDYSNDPEERQYILSKLLSNRINNIAMQQNRYQRSSIFAIAPPIDKQKEYQPVMDVKLVEYLNKLGNLCLCWQTSVLKLFMKGIPSNLDHLARKADQFTQRIEQIKEEIKKKKDSSDEASYHPSRQIKRQQVFFQDSLIDAIIAILDISFQVNTHDISFKLPLIAFDLNEYDLSLLICFDSTFLQAGQNHRQNYVIKNLHVILTQKIPAAQAQLQRIKRKEFTKQEKQLIIEGIGEFVYSMDNYDQAMQILQKQNANFTEMLNPVIAVAAFLKQQLAANNKQLQAITTEINSYTQNIVNLQQGYEYETIIIQQFKRGDAYVPQWHSRICEETVRTKLITHNFKSEAFKLQYPPQFDPSGLLKTYIPKDPKESLRLKCKNAILRKWRVNKYSNQVEMMVQYLLPQENSEHEQYTFLKIHRQVPSAQYHQEEIHLFKHCQADSIKTGILKTKQSSESLIKYQLLVEGVIPAMSQQLAKVRLKMALLQKANEQFKILQAISLIDVSAEHRLPHFIQLKQKDIENLQNLAASCQIQIKLEEEVRMQLQSQCQFVENARRQALNQHQLQTGRRQRLAFLINQQLSEGVPQTLLMLARKFLQKADSFELSGQVQEQQLASVKEKKRQLESYYDYYQEIKDHLLTTIPQVLK